MVSVVVTEEQQQRLRNLLEEESEELVNMIFSIINEGVPKSEGNNE